MEDSPLLHLATCLVVRKCTDDVERRSLSLVSRFDKRVTLNC